jgi:phosphate transport system substrate-binding protein
MPRFTSHASRAIIWVLLFTLLAACAETPQVTRTPVTLRLAEAADQATVLDRVVKDYARDHDWVTITTTSLSPQDAVAQVRGGQLDAAIVHTAPDPSSGVWVSGLAYDPIAIIVHPTNPIGDLTLQQVVDLFQGRTFDWTSFGGTGEVIPVSREAEAYSRQLFESRIMQNHAVTRNALLKTSAQNVIDFVAATPGAIGYVPLSQVDARVKAISLDGIAPKPETAASGKYSLAAPLYMISKSEPEGDLRGFAAWLLGDDGQTLLGQLGLGRVR